MAYHAEDSDVYHIYKNCEHGNNVETRNRKGGTGGKKLCFFCKKRKEGK